MTGDDIESDAVVLEFPTLTRTLLTMDDRDRSESRPRPSNGLTTLRVGDRHEPPESNCQTPAWVRDVPLCDFGTTVNIRRQRA